MKADVGVKAGGSQPSVKGNPDIQPSVTVVIGPGTEIIAGEGKILMQAGPTLISTLSAHNRLMRR